MPAQQRHDENSWYKGTADAIFQNIDILRSRKPAHILILAGDHIYKMDYGAMLADHIQKNADLTIGCLEVSLEEATAFGVMDVDDNRRVKAFVEKPENPPVMPGRTDTALASMGIYIFNAGFLFEQLLKDADNKNSTNDFGKESREKALKQHGEAFIAADKYLFLLTENAFRDEGSALINRHSFPKLFVDDAVVTTVAA